MRQWSLDDDVVGEVRSLGNLEGRAYERVLEKIVAAGQPAAAPLLMSHYWGSPTRPTVLADAIDQLVGGVEPEELVSFSTSVRAHRFWEHEGTTSFRHEFGPRDLRLFDKAANCTNFWGFLSMHWDGHVREAALGRLGKSDSGVELPYILLRANDWVPVVREFALIKIRDRLTPEYRESFAKNLVLVERLLHVGRLDDLTIVYEVAELLREDLDVLLRTIRTGPYAAARSAFEMAASGGVDAVQRAFLAAAKSDDTALRTSAIELAIQKFAGESLREVLTDSLDDPYRMVRGKALEGLGERFLDDSLEELRAALRDPSPANRRIARFYLAKLGEGDFHETYRSWASSAEEEVLRAGLRGLSDIGMPEDLSLVEPHLESPSSRTRRLAIEALAAIDPAQASDFLYEALTDEVRSNSRTAAAGLAKLARVDDEKLWQIFEQNQQVYIRESVLRATDRMPFWTRLCFLLRVATTASDPLLERVDPMIRSSCQRFNQVYTDPGRHRAELESWRSSTGRLSRETVETVRVAIDHKL